MWALIIIVVAIVVFLIFSSKKTLNSDIIERAEKNEKDHYFNKFYAEYKNYTISELNDFIEFNKKDSYNEYSTEDKMKFKAQKTLIREKTLEIAHKKNDK